jgi:hypothetical protein
VSVVHLQTAARLDRILEAHERIERAAGDMLQWAMVAGECLRDQKRETDHGSWGNWVERNCPFSVRTAEVYMQLFENRGRIDQANPQRSAHLSLQGALKQIQKPAERKPRVSPDRAANVLREMRSNQDLADAVAEHHSGRQEALQEPVRQPLRLHSPAWTPQQEYKLQRARERLLVVEERMTEAHGARGLGAEDLLSKAATEARFLSGELSSLAATFR